MLNEHHNKKGILRVTVKFHLFNEKLQANTSLKEIGTQSDQINC